MEISLTAEVAIHHVIQDNSKGIFVDLEVLDANFINATTVKYSVCFY